MKKRESNRHWDGHGKIMIDRRAVNEYLTLIGEKEQDVNTDKLSIHERLARNKEKIQMQSARNGKENGIEIE